MTRYHGRSDAELVALTLRGDNDAYDEIVARWGDLIWRTARRLVGDALAEDVAQEALIAGYMQLSSLREPDKVAPWLCGIARRQAMRVLSRQRPVEDFDAYTEILPDDADTPEVSLLRRERDGAVRAAIARLPEKSRVTAELFYLHELSIAEIAIRLGVPPGTIKSRLHDAREKLKGELSDMREFTASTPAPDLVSAVREQIDRLNRYYSAHNGSWDGFDELWRDADRTLSALPVSDETKSLRADLDYRNYCRRDEDKALFEKARQSAIEADNGEILANLWVARIINVRDCKKWIDMIDNEALPELEKYPNLNGRGILLFWRGRAILDGGDIEEAERNFAEAEQLIDPSDVYHACAVSALRTIAQLREHADELRADEIDVTSESYCFEQGQMRFGAQPGFGGSTPFWEKRRYSCIYYYASFGRLFYDTAMQPGETRIMPSGDSLTLVGYDAAVAVPAGSYDRCMLIRFAETDGSAGEVWYADGVGIVKAHFFGSDYDETYELAEVEIAGGGGYFPLCAGNRWRYVKLDLPDWIYQNFSYEMTWSDGTRACAALIHIAAIRRGCFADDTPDTDVCLARAERLCQDWRTAEAIDVLRRGVRANSNQTATLAALAGIDYLTRFAEVQSKAWRICPSSVGMSSLTRSGGRVAYDEQFISFGPYRFGTRFAENRIFGVKPFRYLQQLFGCVWDDAWVPGYSVTKPVPFDENTTVTLTVEDGSSITTAVGSFVDCRKVTVETTRGDGCAEDCFKGYRRVWAGKKEYWFVRGVGIVRFVCTWGEQLDSVCELTEYANPAGGDDYLPTYIGCRWAYDEQTLTAEGYRARRAMAVPAALGERALLSDAQEFWFEGTEEEYNAMKARVK